MIFNEIKRNDNDDVVVECVRNWFDGDGDRMMVCFDLISDPKII